MNHSQLRAFHAVAIHGSFTKAANTLRLSQPTLSSHVSALEEGYGIELFRRSGRTIETTEFGKTLLDITEQYFATEAEALRLLSTAKGLIKGRLKISADAPYCVLPLMAAFVQRFPTVSQQINFGNSEAVMRNLHTESCDVGILAEMGKSDKLHIVPFRTDPLVVAVSRGHAWARRRSIKLENLAEQTMLLREKGSTTRAILETALVQRGIKLGEVMEIGSREAILEAVAVGLGVGVVSEAEFGHDDRIHKLTLSDSTPQMVEYAACLRQRLKDPTIAAFFELVEERKMSK